jgi:hypothetical protein
MVTMRSHKAVRAFPEPFAQVAGNQERLEAQLEVER